MNNEIVVKNYEDLELFFAKIFPELEVSLNKLFLAEIDKGVESLNKNSNLSDVANTVINTAAVTSQLGVGETHLQAILTPEIRHALSDGTAKLCTFHKDGQIFPKIQFADGREIFMPLEKINTFPNFGNVMMLLNQMQILQKLGEIQNSLVDFAETMYRQLTEVQEDTHIDRMSRVKTLKSNFKDFLSGRITKSDLVVSKNEAFISVTEDIKVNIDRVESLRSKIEQKSFDIFSKKSDIEKRRTDMNEQKRKLKYIEEGFFRLQEIQKIEMYIAYSENTPQERNKVLSEICENYSNFLLGQFSQERLWLLNGISEKGNNIWHDCLMPNLKLLETRVEV